MVPEGALPILARVDERSGRRLARSTAIFSLATGLSRILGLVREVVAAYYFGAAGKINAFTVAFQVPNLVRALVADAALSSAFVPVFTELQERGERQRAWRVASSLFWLMLLFLTGLTAIFIVAAPWIIGLFGTPAGTRSSRSGCRACSSRSSRSWASPGSSSGS
jgi:putative peptidoglycan lipid II flippase